MSLEDKIAGLKSEQQELILPYFNESVAWRIGCYIQARAEADNLPIAIEVSKAGHRIFYCAMLGSNPDNAEWIRKKRNVVERFHTSSLLMTYIAEQSGRPLLEKFNLPACDYVASGGGVAVMVENCGCIGAVMVSGLTQYEDHDLGVEAIRAVRQELV